MKDEWGLFEKNVSVFEYKVGKEYSGNLKDLENCQTGIETSVEGEEHQT